MNKSVMQLPCLLALLFIPLLSVFAEERALGSGEKVLPMKLNIQVGKGSFSAVLYDNPSTVAFLTKLPLTINMSELNGNEKFYYFKDQLPSESQNIGIIKTGDLMLYGADCLVIFHKSFTASYRYTRIGYITDSTGLASSLGHGSVQVTFSILK
jgi:hypothetical protein